MAATSPYLRQDAGSNYLWVLVGAGLVAFAVACGVALAMGELQALYVTLSLIVCIAVLFDFRIGAVTLILLLPISDSSLFPHALMGLTGLNPINLLLVGTLAAYLLRGRQQQTGAFVPRPLLWLFMVPIVLAGLIGMNHVDDIVPYFFEREAVAFTNAIGYLRDMVVKPLLLVGVALVAGAAAAKSQKPERFLIPIAISVWLIALLELWFVASSGVQLGMLAASNARRFFDDIGIHANDLGRVYVAAYALLLFAWWETKKPGLKLFLFLTMGVLSFALLLTFSRAAFLGFLLVSALFLAWKFNMKTLALAIAGAAIVVMFAPGYLVTRVTLGFETDANAVSAGRIDTIWLPLLPEIWKSPIWGHGLGSIMWSYPMETGAMLVVGHAHNAFLEAALDMGLLGLGLLLAYYFHVWKGFRALGSNAYLSPEMRGFFQGAAAGLVAFLVTGMSGSSLRPESEFSYQWMAIGLMYGLAARRPTA